MNTKVISFSIMLLVAIAVSSWIAFNAARSMLKPAEILRDDYDFFMTNVVYTQMDENGEVHNQIYTDKLNHYPKDDYYTFNAPHIMMIDKDARTWYIDAKQGTSEKNGVVIDLRDNVKITQMTDASGQAGVNVFTSAAKIYPQKGFAVTDQPVTIIQAGSTVNSVGAEVNFKNSTVKLLSKVQGQYEATEK